jgi:hypothetical protein
MPTSVRRTETPPDDALALVGEGRLLAVLLGEVLRTLATRPSRAALRRARTWICARDPARQFSFEHACAVFGLDPAQVRRRLGLRAHAPRPRSARGFARGPRVV